MIQILSILGFLLCFGAYVLAQRNTITVNSWEYNWMTAVGSLFLLINSLAAHSIGLSLIQIGFAGVAIHKIVTQKLYPKT